MGNSRYFDMTYRWGKFKAYTSGNLHCIRTGQGSKAFLVTHAHLAGVKDMISGLFNTYTYSQLAEHKYLSYSIYKELQMLKNYTLEWIQRDYTT